jgi:hypothetical protein
MVAKFTECIPCEVRAKTKKKLSVTHIIRVHQNAVGNTPKDEIYTWFAFRFKETTKRGRGVAREYYGGTKYDGLPCVLYEVHAEEESKFTITRVDFTFLFRVTFLLYALGEYVKRYRKPRPPQAKSSNSSS